MTMGISRRTVLVGAAVAAAAVGAETLVTPFSDAAPVPAPRRDPAPNPAFTGAVSPNGWPVNARSDDGGSVWQRPVPGTGFPVKVASGAAEVILVHVVRRFHYEIDALGRNDVIGFRAPAGLRGHALNHASGTAVDIRPGRYPAGVRGGFFPRELAVIRDILAECDGVVRWGGDLRTPDEAHFEIHLPPDHPRVAALAARFSDWNATPGRGAGVLHG